jgi:hypothetical protein
MAIWYNVWLFWCSLWSFGYIFPVFVCLDKEKSGNPDLKQGEQVWRIFTCFAMVYFGQFFVRKLQQHWATFFCGKSHAGTNFYKNGVGYILEHFTQTHPEWGTVFNLSVCSYTYIRT